MNDSVIVNQVYLIFNRPLFLVDSSVTRIRLHLIVKFTNHCKHKTDSYRLCFDLDVSHSLAHILERKSKKRWSTDRWIGLI